MRVDTAAHDRDDARPDSAPAGSRRPRVALPSGWKRETSPKWYGGDHSPVRDEVDHGGALIPRKVTAERRHSHIEVRVEGAPLNAHVALRASDVEGRRVDLAPEETSPTHDAAVLYTRSPSARADAAQSAAGVATVGPPMLHVVADDAAHQHHAAASRPLKQGATAQNLKGRRRRSRGEPSHEPQRERHRGVGVRVTGAAMGNARQAPAAVGRGRAPFPFGHASADASRGTGSSRGVRLHAQLLDAELPAPVVVTREARERLRAHAAADATAMSPSELLAWHQSRFTEHRRASPVEVGGESSVGGDESDGRDFVSVLIPRVAAAATDKTDHARGAHASDARDEDATPPRRRVGAEQGGDAGATDVLMQLSEAGDDAVPESMHSPASGAPSSAGVSQRSYGDARDETVGRRAPPPQQPHASSSPADAHVRAQQRRDVGGMREGHLLGRPQGATHENHRPRGSALQESRAPDPRGPRDAAHAAVSARAPSLRPRIATPREATRRRLDARVARQQEWTAGRGEEQPQRRAGVKQSRERSLAHPRVAAATRAALVDTSPWDKSRPVRVHSPSNRGEPVAAWDTTALAAEYNPMAGVPQFVRDSLAQANSALFDADAW